MIGLYHPCATENQKQTGNQCNLNVKKKNTKRDWATPTSMVKRPTNVGNLLSRPVWSRKKEATSMALNLKHINAT